LKNCQHEKDFVVTAAMISVHAKGSLQWHS